MSCDDVHPPEPPLVTQPPVPGTWVIPPGTAASAERETPSVASATTVAASTTRLVIEPGIPPPARNDRSLGMPTVPGRFSPRQGRMGGGPQLEAPGWTGV